MIRKSYRQASVHEYINITKQLPSTNPIRSPTPDIHSRKERIEKTLSPVIPRSSLKNITNSQKKLAFGSQNHEYEQVLQAKDSKIAALNKEIENLKKNPSKLSNSSFSNGKGKHDDEDTIEKLKSIIKSKDEENSELKKRMDSNSKDFGDKNDNKIREILLKFHQEINALKAENKLLNDKLEHTKEGQKPYTVTYKIDGSSAYKGEPIKQSTSHTDRKTIDGKPYAETYILDSNYKPQPGSIMETRLIDGNNVSPGSYNQTASPLSMEKSKKAMVHQQIQGGATSPYHEPHPLNNPSIIIKEDPTTVARLNSLISDKDSKIKILAEELERMNDVLKLKQHENEALKERIGKNPSLDESIHLKQILQSKLQELEDLKNRLPSEDYEKLKSLASKTPALLEEIKNLNEVIVKLRREGHENEEKIKLLAHEIERLGDLLKSKNVHDDHHNDEKIALLAQEIERLSNLVKTQNAELQRLRSIDPLYENLKKDHDILSEKYANKNKALEGKLKELELLKEKCLLIDKAFSNEKQGLHDKASSLEKRTTILLNENQDLNKMHRKSVTEKEVYEKENLRLNGLNQELAQEIKRLTDTLKAKIDENESKSNELMNLRHKLQEVENHKITALSSHEHERKKSQSIIQDNDRKNLVIESLNQEINSLRNRLLEQESKGFTKEREHEKLKKSHQELAQNINSIQNEKEFFNQKNQEKIQAYEAELQRKEDDLRELRQKLMHAEQEKAIELGKVRESISENQLKHENERRKTVFLISEKENLLMENENLKKEKSDFNNKCNQLKKALFEASNENSLLKTQSEESFIKIVILSALNESLSDDFSLLRNELLDLNNRYQKMISEKSYEEIKFKESLNETQKHHEREKRKSIQAVAEKDALHKTLDLVSKDKEDLHKRLYDNEVKMIDLQSQVKKVSADYEEALIKIVVLSTELERVLESIDSQNSRQRQEIEDIRKEYDNKNKALSEWKKKEVDDLKNEFENDNRRLLNMIKNLEEQNENLMRKHANDRADFISKYEKAMKDTITKNINDMNESHKQELDRVQDRISEHQKVADKYKQELEKMASMMSEKHEEVSNWREKVQKLEQQRLVELEELKKHLELLKSSYVNNPHNLELQAERLAYETNINQLKSRISSLESALKEKSFRQDAQLRDYESKTMELRTRLEGFESSKDSELFGLREVNEKLKSQIEETKDRLQRSESETRRLELEVKQLQIALGAIRSDLEQTQKSLELERLENSRLVSRVKEAEKVYRKDVEEILKKDNVDRTKEFELEISEISRKRDEFKEKAENNERALTEMNGVLVEKIQELEKMKGQYHDAINNIHMLEGKLLEKLQEDEVYIS